MVLTRRQLLENIRDGARIGNEHLIDTAPFMTAASPPPRNAARPKPWRRHLRADQSLPHLWAGEQCLISSLGGLLDARCRTVPFGGFVQLSCISDGDLLAVTVAARESPPNTYPGSSSGPTADAARDRAHSGAGMGLAIAKP